MFTFRGPTVVVIGNIDSIDQLSVTLSHWPLGPSGSLRAKAHLTHIGGAWRTDSGDFGCGPELSRFVMNSFDCFEEKDCEMLAALAAVAIDLVRVFSVQCHVSGINRPWFVDDTVLDGTAGEAFRRGRTASRRKSVVASHRRSTTFRGRCCFASVRCVPPRLNWTFRFFVQQNL